VQAGEISLLDLEKYLVQQIQRTENLEFVKISSKSNSRSAELEELRWFAAAAG
jgi:hypothetical protein